MTTREHSSKGGVGDNGGGGTSRLSWSIVIFSTMAVIGAAGMVRGPVMPALGASFGAPEWQVGLVAPAATVGYLLSVSAVGFGAGHLDPRRLIVGGLVGNALVMFALAAAPRLSIFLVGVALQGATIGAVRATSRPLLSHFYPSRRGRVFSLYDMTWAVGAAIGPLLVIAALSVAGWRYVFLTLGVLFAGLAARVFLLSTPDVESDEEPFSHGDVFDLLRRPEVLAMAVVMFFASGTEAGLFLWLPTYADGELPATLASLTLTLFVAAYVPGRFVVGRLTDRVGQLPLLAGVFVLLLPVFGWTFAVADGLSVLAGIVGIGLLASVAFPLLTSYATDAAPEYSGPVTAIAAVSASAGGGIVPALMGVAISGSGAQAGMQLLAIPLSISLLLVLWAGVTERERNQATVAASSSVGHQPAD